MSNLAMISIMQDRLHDALARAGIRLWRPSERFWPDRDGFRNRGTSPSAGEAGLRGGGKELFTSLADARFGYEQNEVYAEAADVTWTHSARATTALMAFLDRVGHHRRSARADQRLLLLSRRGSTSDGASSMMPSAALREYPPGTYDSSSASVGSRNHRCLSQGGRGDIGRRRGCVASASTRRDARRARMRRVGELLRGIVDGPDDSDASDPDDWSSYPWHLTFLADFLAPRLSSISDEALRVVESAAKLHPDRWRADLRHDHRRRTTGRPARGGTAPRGDRRPVRYRSPPSLAKGRRNDGAQRTSAGLYPVA